MRLTLNFEAEPFEGYTEFDDEFIIPDPEIFEFEAAGDWMSEVSRNSAEYVRWIQQSLNKVRGSGLAVDGIIGTYTRSAIRSFQQSAGLTVDGIVGPITEAALIRAGASAPPGAGSPTPVTSAVNTQLPSSGAGFYGSTSASRRYGTAKTIQALQAVGAAWQRAHPSGPRIGIGDISLQGGGYMSPHVSHQKGIDADIRLITNNGKEQPTTINSSNYSRALTQELVNKIRANGVAAVYMILFNDKQVSGVKPWKGHDNHLHVRFVP
jgi:hypothetical protein